MSTHANKCIGMSDRIDTERTSDGPSIISQTAGIVAHVSRHSVYEERGKETEKEREREREREKLDSLGGNLFTPWRKGSIDSNGDEGAEVDDNANEGSAKFRFLWTSLKR